MAILKQWLRARDKLKREVESLKKEQMYLNSLSSEVGPRADALANLLGFLQIDEHWNWGDIFSPTLAGLNRMRGLLSCALAPQLGIPDWITASKTLFVAPAVSTEHVAASSDSSSTVMDVQIDASSLPPWLPATNIPPPPVAPMDPILLLCSASIPPPTADLTLQSPPGVTAAAQHTQVAESVAGPSETELLERWNQCYFSLAAQPAQHKLEASLSKGAPVSVHPPPASSSWSGRPSLSRHASLSHRSAPPAPAPTLAGSGRFSSGRDVRRGMPQQMSAPLRQGNGVVTTIRRPGSSTGSHRIQTHMSPSFRAQHHRLLQTPLANGT